MTDRYEDPKVGDIRFPVFCMCMALVQKYLRERYGGITAMNHIDHAFTSHLLRHNGSQPSRIYVPAAMFDELRASDPNMAAGAKLSVDILNSYRFRGVRCIPWNRPSIKTEPK